jgi:LasA protease
MRQFCRVAGPMAALVVGIVLIASTPVAAAPGSDPTVAVQEVVAAKAHARADAERSGASVAWADTRATVLRSQAQRWVFGTVVLVAPQVAGAQPRDWLFLGELRGGTWEVGLDGEPAFAALAARSPVVSATEREIFASHGGNSGVQANGDYRTGMRLPYGVNQSWALVGGPHAYDAGSGPWSSVDLTGGDQRVLAARRGVAYTPCVGLVRIVHDRGYSTRYYHLINHIWVQGTTVDVGTFLGNTGTEVGCGGSALARHVHFSLMQNGSFVGIAYHIIGKWVFINGSDQYLGYALHGSAVAGSDGDLMKNYGALGFTQGIVDADDGGTVNRRAGPGTGYAVVGSVTDGTTISIACSANGTTHSGRWGATSLWNKLTDGTWVSDAFVYTGTDGPVNGMC